MEHQCKPGCDHSTTEIGIHYNLYQKIDKDRVECLNECQEGSGVTVFKAWEERLDREKYVESDIDPELLFNIPFTGNVKLKSLIVIPDDEFLPTSIQLYKNRPHMTFDDINSKAEQTFILNRDPNGQLEYPLRTVKFSSVHHLSLYFHSNIEKIRIYYIGLKGEWSPAHNHGATICTYEARPLIGDHPKDFNEACREVS